MTENDAQVRDNPDESRYEIRVDGQLAGFTEYVQHGDVADFVHTEIEEQYEGRGLATVLIGQALDDARRRGWQVMPYCAFVRRFVQKHPDYRDLVPAEGQARFGLVGG